MTFWVGYGRSLFFLCTNLYGVTPLKIATRNFTVAKTQRYKSGSFQTAQLYRSGWQYCVDQPHQVFASVRMQQLAKC